jgi:hypothetical protein
VRTLLACLALTLLVLSVAGAGVEALAGCDEPCTDEAPGQSQCSKDVCCSCCVHSGPLTASLPLPVPVLVAAGPAGGFDSALMPPGRVSKILHVPKPITA